MRDKIRHVPPFSCPKPKSLTLLLQSNDKLNEPNLHGLFNISVAEQTSRNLRRRDLRPSTNPCSVTVRTSRTNDVLIAYTFEDLDIQTSCTFSLSDTAGLSWTSRSGIVFGNFRRDQLQEFWAKTAAVLSSDTITESIAGCGNEYNGLMVFAVSGAKFNSPFDPNTSLPGTGSSYGGTTSVTISTSRRDDMIIAASRLNGQTPGPGLTLIISTDLQMIDSTAYELVEHPVTNLSVTFTSTITTYWEAIADALQSR